MYKKPLSKKVKFLILVSLLLFLFFLFRNPFSQNNSITSQNLRNTTISHGNANAQRTNVFSENVSLKNPIVNLLFKQGNSMDENIVGSPVYADGMLFFANIKKGIYALDAKTGKQVWKNKGGTNNRSRPVVANGIVYVARDGGIMQALDEMTGNEIWEFETREYERESLGSKYTYNVDIDTPPIVDNNKLFFASGDDYIYALDLLTGKKLWEFREKIALFSSLSSFNNTLYVIGTNTYAIDENTGKLIWGNQYRNINNYSDNLAIANSVIYLIDQSRDLVALDILNGDVKWKVNLTTNINAYVSNPTVSDKNVYLTDKDGYLYIINAITGEKIATIHIGNLTLSPPIISGNNIYFTSNGNKTDDCGLFSLFMVDAATGVITKRINLDSDNKNLTCGFDSAPSVGGGRVYVVKNYHDIYSITNK